jgi:hypothetical protein
MPKSKKIKADFTPKAKDVEEVKKVKPTVVKTVPHYLKHVLSHEELLFAGTQMSEARQKQIELENELKSIVANHKAKIQEQAAIVDARAQLLSRKYDYRDTPCRELYNYESEQVTIIRNDTEEIVECRPMNKTELEQLPLDWDEGKEADHGLQS